MSKPSRPSDPANATGQARKFFVTTNTAGKRGLLQSERMASLFVDVLRTSTEAGRFVVHEFVVMPDHVHLLLTVPGDVSIERAVQLIKGNFSFRVRKELGFQGEVWQRGFSDVRITTAESFRRHRVYLNENPVKAGLAQSPEDYVYSSAAFGKLKRAGAEARLQRTLYRHDSKSCPDTSLMGLRRFGFFPGTSAGDRNRSFA